MNGDNSEKVEAVQRLDRLFVGYNGEALIWLAARHFDENVFGFGLSKDIFEALWRFDISATRLKEGRTAISVVTNMDYSWIWFEKNFYGYLEYFRNGVGEKQLNRLNSALQSRLERGELFTRNRNYFGSGLQIELTPLLNFHTNWIDNLHDNSGLFQIRGIYDWLENLQFIGWLDLPYGDSESELGGNSGSGNKAYCRVIYYF